MTETCTARKRCGHCYKGYRTDYHYADHFGVNTVATRKCDAGEKACKAHQCYYIPVRVAL